MKLSNIKKERISEQILALLYQEFPKQLFTAEIARELARDEEFVKSLMSNLNERGLVVSIKKNSKGIYFIRRIRWQLSSKAYEIYHKKVLNLK